MDTTDWIVVAGWGQLAVVVGSLGVPRALNWKDELQKVGPLIRQIFWTYAGYILCTNLAFALVSILGSDGLTDGSSLAASVTGFITVYWFARIMIQFFYFDRESAPKGLKYTVGEVVLVVLFVFFTAVYGTATFSNLSAAEGAVGVLAQ
jgi:hypothetical protein